MKIQQPFQRFLQVFFFPGYSVSILILFRHQLRTVGIFRLNVDSDDAGSWRDPVSSRGDPRKMGTLIERFLFHSIDRIG